MPNFMSSVGLPRNLKSGFDIRNTSRLRGNVGENQGGAPTC